MALITLDLVSVMENHSTMGLWHLPTKHESRPCGTGSVAAKLANWWRG